MQFPGLDVVFERQRDALMQNTLGEAWFGDGKADFNALEQIAFHPVRAGGPGLGLAVVVKVINATVFQESAEDRSNPDIVRQAGYAGPKAAGPAYHEPDFHSGT